LNKGCAALFMKKKIFAVFQTGITIGVLYWIFSKPELCWSNLKGELSKINLAWLLFALIFAIGIFCVGSVRWFLLLRVQSFKISLPRVAAITLMGQFFNLVLPGGTGGDVLRAWYLFKEEPDRKTIGFLTLVMDRLLGLFALIIVSVVIIWTRYDWLTGSPVTERLLWTLMLLLGGASSLVGISFLITAFGWQHKLPHRLPGRERMVELASAYELYAKRPGAIGLALMISMVGHACNFTIFYLAACAFSAKVSFWDMFSVMPIISVITSLPISLSGVGVREGLFQKLLGHLCGVPLDTATLISLFGFLVIVTWSLVGGIVFQFYKPTPDGTVSLTEMELDVEEIEHHVADDV